MEIISVLKKLLLLGVLGIGILLFLFWWGFYRTQATNISEQTQYAEFVGKEVTAKHESFIALNYKPFVQENPFILQMFDRFNEDARDSYTLPVGTKFKIEDAKSFYNAVSGFSTNYLLGSVFIKELNKDVKFEIQWGNTVGLGSDEIETYDLFHVAPWLSEALPYKFYHDGRKEAYLWPPRIRDYNFSTVSHRFVPRDTPQLNRNFDIIYSDQDDWGTDKVYFGQNSVLTKEEISFLKLEELYSDYSTKADSYAFHSDYNLELSREFITLIPTIFKGEHEMESHLINYDLDGNIIDHLKISYDEIAEGMIKKEFVLMGNKITIKDIVSLDTETVSISTYEIQDDGKIIQLEETKDKP